MKTKSIVKSALFIALVFIFTMIAIPNGLNGYTNLGDALILISTSFLSPIFSFFVGSVGSALADVSLGYFTYAPATFVIKGLIPVIFFVLSKVITKKIKNKRVVVVISATVAELFMVVGYYFYSSFLYSSFAAPLISIPSDLIQGFVGVLIFIVATELFSKNKFLNRLTK